MIDSKVDRKETIYTNDRTEMKPWQNRSLKPATFPTMYLIRSIETKQFKQIHFTASSAARQIARGAVSAVPSPNRVSS
jgi:regulatory protein YycH of two-component signal transduction system YycFG